jgi:hypothetical protein
MKTRLKLFLIAAFLLAASLTAGSNAQAFTTRIVNETDYPFYCRVWVYTILKSDPGRTVYVQSHTTVDVDLGAGCQREFIADTYEAKEFSNYELSSGNLGPQCWSRNIYLKADQQKKVLFWEWTIFH